MSIIDRVVIMALREVAAIVAALVSLAFPSELLARGEWPDSPNKPWFEVSSVLTTTRSVTRL